MFIFFFSVSFIHLYIYFVYFQFDEENQSTSGLLVVSFHRGHLPSWKTETKTRNLRVLRGSHERTEEGH